MDENNIEQVVKISSAIDFNSLNLASGEFEKYAKEIQTFLDKINIKVDSTQGIQNFQDLITVLKQYDGVITATTNNANKLMNLGIDLKNLAGGNIFTSFSPSGEDGVIQNVTKTTQEYNKQGQEISENTTKLKQYLDVQTKIYQLQSKGQTQTSEYQQLNQVLKDLEPTVKKLEGLGLTFSKGQFKVDGVQALSDLAKDTTKNWAELEAMISKANQSMAKTDDTKQLKETQDAVKATTATFEKYLSVRQRQMQAGLVGNQDKEYLSALNKEMVSTISTVGQLGASVKNGVLTFKDYESAANRLGISVKELKNWTREYNTENAKIKASQAIKDETVAVNQLLSAEQKLYKAQYDRAKMVDRGAPKTQINAQDELIGLYEESINKITSQNDGIQQNTKYVEQSTEAQKKHNVQMQSFNKEATHQTTTLKALVGQFKETLKTVVAAGLSWKIFSLALTSFDAGVQNVIELDKALTELAKVTDITKEDFVEFKDVAFELAREVGNTGQAVIEATAVFSRSSYDINESLDMSEAALTMLNVADGIESVEDAATTLISILKAYQLEGTEAMSVTDLLNEVDHTCL